MIEPVRVGVVGTSWYPDFMHLPALKSHEQAQIMSICGRNQARVWDMAGKYGIPQVFASYEEMMTRDLLDAVVVAAPDDLHYPITMAALDAGLHVLCENPMAFNLAQAREMLAKAKASGLKHMTYFTWRWMPYMRLMQKLVQDGFIGECHDAQFEIFSDYALQPKYQWKWDRAHGLGVLGDLGSQVIDWAHFLVGDIGLVQARLSSRIARPHPDGLAYTPSNDSASLMLQFKNGASGTIFTSAVVQVGKRGQVHRIQLSGSDGMLEMTADALGYSVRGMRRGESDYQEFPIPREFLEGSTPGSGVWDEMMQIFTYQSVGTRLFIDSIIADCPISPGFEEGLRVQAVLEAALISGQNACWAEVERS